MKDTKVKKPKPEPAKKGEVSLHYYVRSGGDGSAGVMFFDTKKDATKAEEDDFEKYGERWGEPSVSSVQLAIKDGKIVRRCVEYPMNPKTGKCKLLVTWKEIK